MAAQTKPQRAPRWSAQRSFLVFLWLLALAVTLFILTLPYTSRQSSLVLETGQVSAQDVLAPYTLSYQSEVLTSRAREESADAIAPIYGPPDAAVARDQLEQLRTALTFINTVRLDNFASLEQKINDLAALQAINLNQETAQTILLLDNSAWQNVQQETIVVLEQVMRSSIRQGRLEEARRTVPALVTLSMPESQAQIVAQLASGFVAPNSFYSEAATQDAREQARAAVQPISRTFLSNEVIVQRGQVVSEADLEALEQFGLIQAEARWQDYVAVTALVLVMFALAVLFLRSRPELLTDTRGLVVVVILFLLFLAMARLLIVDRTVIPYIFPVAGFALLVATLYSSQAAMVFVFVLSVLVAYNLPNSFDLTLYYFISSLFGILMLKRAKRVMAYFWAGAGAAAAAAAVLLAYRLPLASTDVFGMITLLGAAALNGFGAASLTIVLQLLLAQWLGLTTTIQLMELARPDHPLLQFILRNAPGTYQHSLLIANLAEQAAEAIGADPVLTRIGSLYHDAGKARQPHYFIENQVPGSKNPHDALSPKESAKVILQHVPDGLQLAAKHHLPKRIQDFIAEHHGTLIARYQYAKALEAASGDEKKVDINDFRYPGPKPQSRETALVMLADGCEARTRSERPNTREELRSLVKSVIENRLAQEQLEDTDLTLQDLKVIEDVYVSGLRGVYHPRLVYPELDETTISALDTQPSLNPAKSKR
ncbi:MAG: HDIG domain-containing protein [Anaerolineales bacterium]|nr:HDIG domain-containing protein [Anaerolineales bacterium]